MFTLSRRSQRNLAGVHPDLVRVVKRALQITTVDFCVIEGLRTVERQRELMAAGASHTLRSRHLTGHAVDLAAWVGTVRWDWPLYRVISEAMEAAGAELGVSVEWGGRWVKFPDGPHFQLSWRDYPAEENV